MIVIIPARSDKASILLILNSRLFKMFFALNSVWKSCKKLFLYLNRKRFMSDLSKLYLYRMTHIDNIPHILQYGITHVSSPNANTNYVPIGDESLISNRSAYLMPNGKTLESRHHLLL